MSGETKHVQELALKLPIIEKARLVVRLLASIDQPDSSTDKLWKKEVECRIEAHKAGKMKSISFRKVLAKLQGFSWPSLNKCYDAQCAKNTRFNPESDHLRYFDTPPQCDRDLYELLIDHFCIRDKRPSMINLFEAMLYWKLNSNSAATSNIQDWLDPNIHPGQSDRLTFLLDKLPLNIERDVKTIIKIVRQIGDYKIYGMKSETALPVRTTFLHFLYPDVVPIFDKMVLRAVEVMTPHANQSIVVLGDYLPIAWKLAEQYDKTVRMIDMALWVIGHGIVCK